MARKKRLKLNSIKSYYHIFSKTAGGEFFLNTDEKKNFFIQTIYRLSNFFSIKMLEFVVMTNHFHLVVETCPELYLDDRTILEKAKESNIYKKLVQKNDAISLRKKLTDISEFTKLLKQIYAQWYNRTFKRTGYFWGSRFKSVILQYGKPLFDCMLYVILNPVRAKMVKAPEKYKFSSFHLLYNKLRNKISKGKKLKRLKYEKIERFTKEEIIGSEKFLKDIEKLLKDKEKPST